MNPALIFVLFIAASSGRSFPNRRIMNGIEATPGQFPHQVSLLLTFGEQTMHCGGSLISHRYVLTAAHCLDRSEGGYVLIGAHNLDENVEDHRIRIDFTPDDYNIHEEYFMISMRNDIATLRLSSDVPFSDYVQPVHLPRWTDGDFTDYTGTIAGWGQYQDPSTGLSAVLNYITNPIYSNEWCKERFIMGMLIEDQNVCMSGANGRSACVGDSGGPVTVQVGPNTVQIGVFSFGPASHCLDEIPIVCARVSYYLGWIQANSDVIIEM
ncbi:brachyurin-like [Topomyia yanbarensis]|uniref:brachyurin-like n=1 Tax=Topomyia yanbarensis TaxID=2498891 RepID=UPI00273CC29A|nr:brachyurin-like [Topomyia yanbarensis]